jgi:hypothetical protein
VDRWYVPAHDTHDTYEIVRMDGSRPLLGSMI